MKFVFVGCLLFVALPMVGLLAARPKTDVDMLTVDATSGVKIEPEPIAMAAAPPVKASLAIETAPPKKVLGSQWAYSEVPDSMGKGKIRAANVLSSNEVEFDFPYQGPQRASLMLRTHPRQGKDVLLRIQRGQLLCPSYDDCQVLVRFDDESAVTYAATGPEDGSSETLFISNYSRFFEKLGKAKRVRISANVFQEGSRMFEFDLSGFDPVRYKGEAVKSAR